MQLNGEGPGSDQGVPIDAISNLSRQREKSAVWRHLADERASGFVAESEGFEESGIESDCVRDVEPFCRTFKCASSED